MRLQPTYTIRLDGMHFHAPVGVSADERLAGSDIVVSISIQAEACEGAFRDDRPECAIDYSEVYAAVAAAVSQPARLLEHLAWRIAAAVLSIKGATHTDVAVTKTNPPIGADGLSAAISISADAKQERNA